MSPPNRLRALIALTAVATVVVEVVNLGYAESGRWSLAVRKVWSNTTTRVAPLTRFISASHSG